MDDLVCIVGMACRLPGNVNSPKELWEFLINNQSAQGPVPKMRFNVDGFYDQDGSRAGVLNASGGYFLADDPRQFDNSFFGINNLEANAMDPQQRKLLEVVYECFEHAGISLQQASGSNIGVYVGNFTVDHQTGQTRDPDSIHRYTATGLTLDTACSSSLYCLHTAVSAIRSGDCDSAIVAGVNLIMSPEQCLGTSKAGVLSPTSTCHTFDARADGYGRAEGVNAVYLKKYSDALKDQYKIWAVIRGTSVNANGKTPGITQPSADFQEAVIRMAYSSARLDFADTDYVECHGTGTPVGDPIEIEAVGRCFGRTGAPLMIGSSKPNLGHSEAASGLTALIKVVMALEYRRIPPTHGLTNLNPKLKLEARNIQVVSKAQEWPKSIRRASVNAFGYGGANAHAILESASAKTFDMRNGESPPHKSHETFTLPVSAASPKALAARVDAIKMLIGLGNAEALCNLSWTLAERRSHFKYRRVLSVKAEAESFRTVESEGINKQQCESNALVTLPVGFVFTGQGAQYAGMATELLLKNITFLKAIRAMDEVLQTLPQHQAPVWTLEQTLLDPPETSQINNVTRSQPVCTAVQISLVDVLHSWGIEPSAGVVGHSSGEIAAAYAAGSLTATQAILVAYFRGYAVGQMRTRGAMLAASLSPEEAERLLEEKRLVGEVCVACINSPESVTLSGSLEGINVLMNEIQERQHRFARKLATDDRPYHSHQMQEAGNLYEQCISPYLENSGEWTSGIRTRFFSSVADRDAGPKVFDGCLNTPKYWRKNLEMPVQFHYAMERLIASQKRSHLIEIGPHPAMRGPLEQIRKHMGVVQDDLPYEYSLMRKSGADASIRRLAGSLYLHGHTLNWRNVNFTPDSPRGKPTGYFTDIPPYPWDYSAGLLWHEPRMSAEIRCRRYPRHELLGSQQVAGNGIDWIWRNILKLDEVPWLRDHKIDGQIVLPAACYLAMAMEALLQMRSPSEQAEDIRYFEFNRIHLNAALVIPDKADGDQRVVEIHTAMSAQRLSSTTSSSKWYDFSISSWTSGKAITHCTGRLNTSSEASDSKDDMLSTESDDLESNELEEWTRMERWYEKFDEGGLSFGPSFRSVMNLKTDANRLKREALGQTLLDPPVAETFRDQRSSLYCFHPVVIDACLQLAIMGTTAGNVNDLRVAIPVFVESCRITPIQRHSHKEWCKIQARATKSGISTQRIDSNLYDAVGAVVIAFRQVKMSQYVAETLQDVASSRQPCFRVRWKPDITQIGTAMQGPLAKYLQESKHQQDLRLETGETEDVPIVAGLLDLLGHKNPRMRVLEIGAAWQNRSNLWRHTLEDATGFQRYASWHEKILDKQGLPTIGQDDHPFDVILVHEQSSSKDLWSWAADKIISQVAHQGSLITHRTERAMEALNDAQFTILEVSKDLILAMRPDLTLEYHRLEQDTQSWQKRAVIIVKPQVSVATTGVDFGDVLAMHLRQRLGLANVKAIDFGEAISHVQYKETVWVSLLEVEQEYLATMDQHNMDSLRSITNQARTLVWVTGASMLGKCPNPSLTLCSGLSRALMLEQPSLNFIVLDLGSSHRVLSSSLASSEVLTTCHNITNVIKQALCDNTAIHDKEFIQQDGLLHISRFVPDTRLNNLFQRRLSLETQWQETFASETRSEMISLESARPARLEIGQVGVSQSIHFQQVREPSSPPGAGFIDVLVRAVSLNAKDVYALNGRTETRDGTIALEFSGVVTATGPGVSHLQPGEAVVVLAPCHFCTTERVPAWAAHKMLPGEEPCVLSTLPVIFSTALYALKECGRLRKGESVLIHSGAGAFGLAAIAVAQHMGAVIYTTASTAERRAYVANRFGLPETHVFQSRNASFADGVKLATGGRGVDIVVNSLVGDLLHASWDCIAPFGRFVEIGKRELVDDGKLDMHIFSRNATFSAFDLSDLYYHQDQSCRDTLRRLTLEVLQSYRSGQIQPVPTKVFPASDVAQAYRFFSSKDRIGKIVISLEDDKAPIPVAPAKYLTLFDPNKVYFLVGCLGGLGRSLSRWMLARGARHFCFLGRSGCDKQEAKELVSRLKAAGANVTVVRGDVRKVDDVAKAVGICRATGKHMGGIVQAAMGLNESVFANMTNDAWHTGIQPKWQGTLNLHRAIGGAGDNLEFFLMMSSVSGTVGTATESNYCAANCFLDAFAHYLRLEGLPAISLGLGMISEVGYLHENPDIEALLLRRGVKPLSETEFLQVVDFALAESRSYVQSQIKPWTAHILTGLEPFRAQRLKQCGFEVNHSVMDDPRASLLKAAWEIDRKSHKEAAKQQTDDSSHSRSTEAWFKGLPVEVAGSLLPESNAPSLHTAVLRLVRKRFSNLLLVPLDQIEDDQPLIKFGIDSLIASEFRTWIWKAFKLEVPLLDLMSQERTLRCLSNDVGEKLIAIGQRT